MQHEDDIQPSRRRILGMLGGLGGLGVIALAGCGDDSGTTAAAPPTTTGAAGTATTTASSGAGAASTTTAAAGATTAASCTAIPQETAGPYPGDGTNGPNVLTQSGVVRSDIRSSFGTSTTTASGVPLKVTLTVVDKSTCTPIAGAAVYAWHCDRNGNYSLYSSGVTNENFLRGVQATDASGNATFTTIFPGAYLGRWPHIHFEVFSALANATSGKNAKATSQLALPQESCTAVYATSGYESSAKNFPQTPIKSDNVFSDGWTTQTPTVTGSATAGYAATLVVAI
jgi:protocatechuate 3,4-dioxygenase beta subunit